ncbi:hypothetical protein N657DRAFT_650339 [Parathielavia appendiculata]|uniref:Uncharacterized protein n=1 Tax=Parathielavia appendiculata TaxID=2587402 RepID=A0AAN6TRC3_9PEZI|nr:hypothetical protein N657DRAFT_650339 [Parathielavia appendiculata]
MTFLPSNFLDPHSPTYLSLTTTRPTWPQKSRSRLNPPRGSPSRAPRDTLEAIDPAYG